MAGIVLLALLVVLGLASLLGFTADSRDPQSGIGPVIRGRDAKAPGLAQQPR